jgi:hypothetical protein
MEGNLMIKSKFIIIILCISIIISIFSGCIEESNENKNQQDQNPKDGDIKYSTEEVIGGKYNTKMKHGEIFLNNKWHNFTNIEYNKDNTNYETAYIEHFFEVFMWIRNNTPDYATFLNWWDYGGMIEGIGERESIAVYPSLSLIHSIGSYDIMDEEGKKRYIREHEFTDNKTIKDIANVLTADNISEESIQNILEIYDIDYILTRSYDLWISNIFFSVTDKNFDDYFIDYEPYYNLWKGGTPTENANNTLIYRMWSEEVNISELDLIYEFNAGGSNDPNVNSMIIRIFKII